jgi:hypothetical protein
MSSTSSGTALWNLSTLNPYSRGQDSAASGNDFYFELYTTSSVYQSASNATSGITAWSTFQVNNVLNSGTINYAIYGDTDSSFSYLDPGTFTSSQTITSGSIPAIATAAYAGWSAAFTHTASTQTSTINDVTVNWFGSSTASVYTWGTVDKNHRIMWAVAEGTSSVPTATYIYDPRFGSWLKYSQPFQAPARVGDTIYYGGVSTGVVYSWPSGNTDNGSAITAYWKSKDFISGDPFSEKDYTAISLIGRAQTGSNLDITYTVNTTSAIANNFSLTDSNSYSLKRINFPTLGGTAGTFFNIKFGNDDGDAPFEVYTIRYDYEPRPWRVIPEQ